MPDQPVAKKCPLGARDKRDQFPLDLFRVGLLRESEALSQPRDVCVHDDALIQPERGRERLAVLRPTPSSWVRAAIVRGTLPWCFSSIARQQA